MATSESLKERFSAMGAKLKVGGAEVGRKVSEQMNLVGGRVKEIFQAPTPGARLVEEATAENLRSPDWVKFMGICDSLNEERISGQEVVRAIRKRIATRNAGVQLLALTLLETCLKNYEKLFAEMASERLLDDLVKMVEDPQTWSRCRDKVLMLLEAWGESTEELCYLPVYEETYKSMRMRGVRFPGRDPSSLAPIFTPPRSDVEINPASTTPSARSAVNMQQLSPREILDVAKNSVEVLSAVLATAQSREVAQEELTVSLVQQCKQAQSKVQRMAQGAGDDGALLFESLTVNDELQQVLAKFAELASPQEKKKPAEEPAMVTALVVQDGATDQHRASKSHSLSDLDEDD